MLPKQADMCEHGVPIGFWKEFIQLTCDLFLLEMVYHFVLPYGFISDNIWWMENPMIAWREIRIQFSAWKSNFFFFFVHRKMFCQNENGKNVRVIPSRFFFFLPVMQTPTEFVLAFFFLLILLWFFSKVCMGAIPYAYMWILKAWCLDRLKMYRITCVKANITAHLGHYIS